ISGYALCLIGSSRSHTSRKCEMSLAGCVAPENPKKSTFMHPQTVFAKTARGVLEIKNKTIKLPREVGLVFLSVDGKSAVADLAQKSGLPTPKLDEALDKLVADGYIKIFSAPGAATLVPVAKAAPPPPPQAQDLGDDLDFTSPEAVAKLNAEAENRLKAE